MKLKNFFRRGRLLPPFVNLCGLFARPKGDLEIWLKEVFAVLQQISNAGCSGVLFWLPWPLAKPSLTPEWRRNEMIVLPDMEKDEWTKVLNYHFFDNIYSPIIKRMKKLNLIPVIGMTGYTNKQILYPISRSFKKGSLYHLDTLDIIHAIMEIIKDDDCIYELTNEPEAGMQVKGGGDKIEGVPFNVWINVMMARFHVHFYNMLDMEFDLHERNVQFNISDGVDYKTGKDIHAVEIAGLLTQHFRGKINVLKTTMVDIWKNKKSTQKTDIIFTCHGTDTVTQVTEYTSWSRLKLGAFGVSLDGSLMETTGMQGNNLYIFTDGFIRAQRDDRAGLLYLHPRDIYKFNGAKDEYWLHTIHINDFEAVIGKYIEPAIDAYVKHYGNPPNYEKSPPEMIIEEEPDGPVIAPEPVEPDPIIPEKKSKLKLIIYALAIIIILVILGAIL